MKKYVFSILLVIYVILAGCQNNKSFGIWDYTIDSLPDERTMMFKYFSEVQHNSPFLNFVDVDPKARQIGDTLYYIIQYGRSTIYVYNTISYQVKEIPIKNGLLIAGIKSVYYHNHDSIFLLIDQPFVQKAPQRFKEKGKDIYDIILINGQGDCIGNYTLDHPLKYTGNGSRDHTLFP
ncbi:MAG: hypothetical protein J6Y47_08345, partial [Bacteroidales bacterium]|nr:hypothetical protein [Bacteroidales bacterium]